MSLNQYQLQYQISPIILTGGIAGNVSGGMLPLLSITNTNAFSPNLLSTSEDFQLDDAFGIFQPVVGGSLVQQQIAQYPFANLSVAANAIIRDPLNVSLIMFTPMKTAQAWAVKLAIMTALKATLDAHNNAGGTYTVCTPGYIYTNMLMLSLTDVSMGQSPLPQNAWRWDFYAPLVTAAQAQAAMSNLMNQITAGVPTTGATTDPTTAIGQPASSVNVGAGAGGTAPVVDATNPAAGGSIVPFTTSTATAVFDPLTNQPTNVYEPYGNLGSGSYILGTS
jgi:hypothetical protein